MGFENSGLVFGSDVIDIEGLRLCHGVPVTGVEHDGRAGGGGVVPKPNGVSELMNEYALNKVGQVGCVSRNGGCVQFNAEAYDLTARYRGVVDTIGGVIEVSGRNGVGGTACFGKLYFGTGIVPVAEGGIHGSLPRRGVVVSTNRNGGAWVAVG